jgi:uncharacterized protein with ParB-like and HNH nuclease domain/predicted transport protein
MQARDVFLSQLMQGPKQFLIPIFQRTYSWHEPHCMQLYRDILKAGKSSSVDSHFTGSVVLIANHQTSASIPQWLIIDGQQRLTTVTLLMAAVMKRASQLGLEQVSMTPLAAIRGYYLINEYGQDDAAYKLLLTKADRGTLCALLDNKEFSGDVSENVRANFNLFCEWLADAETIERIYSGFQKLKVVEVVLQQNHDDPQAIFESLNSTGVDLSQADLIRNYVLMRQDYETQTQLYLDFWYPMECLFGREESQRFDRFMQDFLTLETGSNTLLRSVDVYSTFKDWFSDQVSQKSVEYALERMLVLARFHTAYMFGAEKNPRLAAAFKRLRTLAEVVSPTIMRLYEGYRPNGEAAEPTLPEADFLRALSHLESYLLRRQICAMQTRSLGNVFANLAQLISLDKPLETLEVSLARFKRNNRFPSDVEFREALVTHDIYGMRIQKYLLDSLENDSKEIIDTSSFSIEHVLPQNENLRSEWKKMLGKNWQEIQQTWLHRLGNLTLTGYNSEYSDIGFEEKKRLPNGFNDSPLRLNRFIAQESEWTEVQICERGESLAVKALKIWKPLKVDEKLVAQYALKERRKRSQEYSLSDVFSKKHLDLLGALTSRVTQMGSDISPIVSSKNLTFYTLSPFVQVLPRAGHLGVILAVEVDDIDPELSDLVQTTNDWNYIRNGSLTGVYGWLHSESDIDSLMPIIQQAYEQALS